MSVQVLISVVNISSLKNMQIFSEMTDTVRMSRSQIISLSVILNFAQTYSLWGGLGYVPVGQVDILS